LCPIEHVRDFLGTLLLSKREIIYQLLRVDKVVNTCNDAGREGHHDASGSVAEALEFNLGEMKPHASKENNRVC
jgi:hypothetical protein